MGAAHGAAHADDERLAKIIDAWPHLTDAVRDELVHRAGNAGGPPFA
jgi:hypothetical protein